MKEDKAPDWAIDAAQEIGEAIFGRHERGFVMWPLVGKNDQLPALTIALALSQAYERGQESMRERAALHARASFDDRPRRDAMDWNDGFDDGAKAAATAIRSLPIEQEGGK